MSELVSLKRITEGGLGANSQPPEAIELADFSKASNFKCHWIAFRTCSEPFEKTKFLTFES